MSIIKYYKIEEVNGSSVLTVYLESYFVEFANESGDLSNNTTLKGEIGKLINKTLKGSKITLCKVMLGTVLLTTIPAAGISAYASTTQEQGATNISYTVKGGDTLWELSNIFNTTVDDIKQTNDITSNMIYVNQILKIPTTNFFEYTVKSGDTLYRIAKNHNTTVNNIKSINGLTSDTIYTGQKLVLKGTQQSTPVKTTTPKTYKIVAGDTLWNISKRYNIPIETIKSINNLTSDRIYVGQELTLQGNTTTAAKPSVTYINYAVKSGDTQWSIAIDHGIPVHELQSVNGFTDNTALSIDQNIKIPVHAVPVMETKSEKNGEYLDWWEGVQYVFPINATAKVTDYETGKSFNIQRTIGANHADCEPRTSNDAQIAKDIWGGYSWKTRAVIVEVNGRQIAGSMSYMPHSIQYITDNNFNGHFDIHFLNSTRHKDGAIDQNHQEMVKVAAGIQ